MGRAGAGPPGRDAIGPFLLCMLCNARKMPCFFCWAVRRARHRSIMAQAAQHIPEPTLDELAAAEQPEVNVDDDNDEPLEHVHVPMPVFGVQLPAEPLVPDTLRDASNPSQPFSSPVVLANQVAVSMQDTYSVQVCRISTSFPMPTRM